MKPKKPATKHVGLRMTLRAHDRLLRLSYRLGCSKADLLRRAVGVVEVIATAQADGKRVGVLDADGNLVSELYGLDMV